MSDSQTATFAAGCFWGVEAGFAALDGVLQTAVGYSGGHSDNPTYREVCSGTTGHAEVVQISYDPKRITYLQLLDHFFETHDPTQRDRQGPDVGTQYRSAIFFHTPEQKEQAENARASRAASGRHKRPIATAIAPAQPFFRAEEYHQKYFEKNGISHCPV